MKKILLIWMALLCLLAIPVLAEQTQLYSKIYLDPYYREATIANTEYNYTLQVNPPDGLTQVYSATITFEAYFSPSVNVTLKVNNQTCNTPNFYISTTYSGSAQMTASFDCSNIIKDKGNYSVQVKMTKNTGAINGWLDLTYTNKPKPTMDVFGTEYQIGQMAKAWLQLLDSNGTYINDGACFIDIYSPNNTEYIEKAQMTAMNHDGIYYYDLPAPEAEGVYPVIARCYYEATDVHYYATTYHLTIGTLDGGWVATNLQLIDGDKVKFKEADVAGVKRLDIGLNVTNMSSCLLVPESLLTGIEIYAYGKFDSVVGDDITISVYNYTSATWLTLPNKLLENAVWKSASNTFFFNNLTTSGLYNESLGGLKVRFTDTNLTDGGADSLELDQFYVSCNQLSNPVWQEVMGSSEMHISNTTNIITGVWDYLLDVIMPYLEQIWNKLLGIESQLNTTINITNQTLTNTESLLNITGLTFNNTGEIIDMIDNLALDSNVSFNLTTNLIIDNITGLVQEGLIQQLRFVGGTEYVPNQQGKAVVQFLDKNLDPVNTATPYIRLFYPDSSLFINWTAMGLVGNGIYELNFTAPSTYGVYIADAYVLYSSKTYYVSHTFHVSEPENTSILVAINTTRDQITSATANLSTEIADLRTNTTQNFDLTWLMIQALNSSQGQDNSVIMSYLNNITLAINSTQTQLSSVNQSIFDNMNLINQSLSTEIGATSNATQSLINAVNATTQARFDALQSFLDNLSIQVSNNHNITQQNLTDLTNLMLSVNMSLSTDLNHLNVSLYNVRGDLLAEINNTYNYLVAVNQSITADLYSINQSLSTAISDFRAEAQANFTTLFGTLTSLSGDLNSTKAELSSGIANLSLQLNQTELNIRSDLTAINQTLSADLAWLKNDTAYMIEFLKDLNISIEGLKVNLTSNEALLYSIYNNLSSSIAQNTTAVLNQIIATNASLSADISAVKNDTQTIINQIADMNSTMGDQYSNLTLYLGNLQTQISENHNITQSNLTAVFSLLGELNSTASSNYLALNQSIGELRTDVTNYYTDLNSTIYTELGKINQTINQTGENIVGEITSLRNLLLSINQTLTADIIENRNTMLLINSSLSSQMDAFEVATSGNFNTTFALLNGLEAQNNLTHALLGNLSLQLNQTNWDIQSRIDLMNASVHQRFDVLDSNVTTIISLLNNLSINSNTSIQSILDNIALLSAQEDNHFNITQQNITTLFIRCDALNSTITGYYNSLYDALADMNITLLYVNETNTWIMEQLNVSTDDLNLAVTAPNKCLVDTNWLARAQVKDRYGNVLSYIDGVRCNMTTSLWGTANMTYSFVESNFKYIHVCDPANTTFTWAVDCARVS